MRKLFLLFFTFINVLIIDAQLVQVSGYILQKGDSSVSIPHAGVMNKRTRTGYQSTFDGFYTLLVAPNDTIEVTMIGYKTTRVALPIGFTGTTYRKNIYLKDEYVILGDFTKYSITWAKFKQAFESMEVQEEKIYLTIDPSSYTNSSPAKTTTGVTLNGPISWLYNKLGKKAKEQNKLDDLKRGDNEEMESTHRITNQYVMDATKLPEDKVNDFLQFCYSDVDFYAYATDYDIKTKFLSCLPDFKKKYNIVDVVPENNSAPVDSVKTNPH